ncbi:methyltransferase domain-containing protein [Roseobacter sp. YSTF-M11]|uniref:Methyltransferase domain-containing protein n=1 Tax=Roseobacter insulae TaxID=2859783 RepID=A0A9X1K2X3_9RHOB|nr:class I SAM-dependent methyltransferase [Roseobacter insulae]MBW4708027.1 methyltransferase domain-containing protein [Roseobacter insulae]
MSDAYWDAFFVLHRDLPREGPGEPADVEWACRVARLQQDARICDAACGPGADIPALLQAAPDGHIDAMDKTAQFVDQARAAHGANPRVSLSVSDMAGITGPYDMIWCAGALYFLGVSEGLRRWRAALAPGGAVVFSEPCWFTEDRPAAAAQLWAEYPAMTDADGIARQVEAAGYSTVATRRLSQTAWENYYAPLDTRIAALRPDAQGALARVLDEAEAEAASWRAHRDAFGYLLSVVTPDDI